MKMKNNDQKVTSMVQAAVIAALYAALTLPFAPIAYGPVQFRISEALTILPYFTPAAIPGVTLGCLLSNILLGSPLPDIVFGTIATLVGAIFSYRLRKHKYLVCVPPILSNALIIPFRCVLGIHHRTHLAKCICFILCSRAGSVRKY